MDKLITKISFLQTNKLSLNALEIAELELKARIVAVAKIEFGSYLHLSNIVIAKLSSKKYRVGFPACKLSNGTILRPLPYSISALIGKEILQCYLRTVDGKYE